MKTEQEIRELRDNLLNAFNDTGKHKVQFVWLTEIDALSWVLGKNDDWGHIDLINEYLLKKKKLGRLGKDLGTKLQLDLEGLKEMNKGLKTALEIINEKDEKRMLS